MSAVSGQLLTGWGRTTRSPARVTGPLGFQRLQELVASRPPGGVLARGAGLSYGDAAQNAGGYVLDPVTRPAVHVLPGASAVRASASATFADVLAAVVPHGRLLPVLPGTSGLTVGGAIAADVHGKNQRAHGTISAWIEEIELLDGQAELRRVTPADPEVFRATVGGMGLTGVILGATIRLLPIRSTLLRVSTQRLPDLDALLGALDSARALYTVAWVDTTARGRALGRGVLDTADHLDSLQLTAEPHPLAYRPGRVRRAPGLPACPVTPLSARAFNSLWFRASRPRADELTGLAAYFHRLDALAGWNRVLGPRGLIQYQVVVPEGAHHVLGTVIEAVQRERCAPFLGTLKRFSQEGGGYLSFPIPGWSLAIDMPAGNPRLGPLLDRLDDVVASAGGRVYLAKDARLRGEAFHAMYPRAANWQAVRDKLDPAGVFRSDLARRVGLC